jgi:hypothetical protein
MYIRTGQDVFMNVKDTLNISLPIMIQL